MKNKILKLTLFLIILTSSCKDFNREVLGDNSIPVENVEKPSIEKIKNDLLGNKVQTWTFAKLEEFNAVNVINSRILDDLSLEIEISLDMSDYITGKPYKGNVVVSYSRMSKDSSSWEFKEVNGTVYKIESELSDENSDYNQNQNEETEKNYPICDRCGNEIRSTIYSVCYSSSGYVASNSRCSDFDLKQYDQICAEEEADYKNRNR